MGHSVYKLFRNFCNARHRYVREMDFGKKWSEELKNKNSEEEIERKFSQNDSNETESSPSQSPN